MKFGTKRFHYDESGRYLMFGDAMIPNVPETEHKFIDLLNTVVDCVRFRVNRKELSEALERFVATGKDGAK